MPVGADLYRGARLVRQGRPKSASRKQAVSLRLDREVLAHYRSAGPGWQSRINETLPQGGPAESAGVAQPQITKAATVSDC